MKFKELNTPNKLTIIRIILVAPFIILGCLYLILQEFVAPSLSNTSGNIDSLFNIDKQIFVWGIVSRIILVLMFLIFLAAMLTDYFDGKIARKRNLITSFGKLWDPIADKLITTSALIFLAVITRGYASFIIVTLLILRDLIVDGCRVVMKEHRQDISASIWGKIKTIVLTVAVCWILFFNIVWPSLDVVGFMSTKTDVLNNSWIRILIWFVVNIPLLAALVLSFISAFFYIKKASKLTNHSQIHRGAEDYNIHPSYKSKFKDEEPAQIVEQDDNSK
ncbi:CDP-diacylglycerol--glycerol-3-phosphate 3-phosphatidyltransferase [Mycoplasmopsis bovigenitalium]|uniref:CDP-diacylglycerol--glycerol-3-phosphate 3-phosphatidyltransferase n=1 Tax=Mycoplasmopsis bovigenitalium TaxID=2112 RepID=A0A449A9E7_9BACT|nr:CDP-diacylglycerol--glycerol-3-phosphate 3-phosphatidyltransferase [Mycoplasmopsis bovigenitalium]VEU60802.1 CDP-diacylglycerol--glycerol-3-phosphate 3-phosphatidyltransferase [Mycoplasmopsis bovigenitalium]